MKKYINYFDDSSSESDEGKIESNITNAGYITYIQEVTRKIAVEDNLNFTVVNNNVFLLHELGNRIIHSSQVRGFYYKN